MTLHDPAARPSTRSRPPSALVARHWFLAAAPVLAGLLCILGAAADPAADLDGPELVARYAADPEALQWKSIGYHFGYALWGLAAVVIALLVRRRGGWLANGALLAGLLGATTLPGFLMSDFFDSAMGQRIGVEETERVWDLVEGMWGMGVISGTGVAGFLLCLPLAVLAAWRAGLLPWWAALGPLAGLGVGFMVVGANVAGASLMTAGFAVLSVGLARMEPAAWDGSLDRENLVAGPSGDAPTAGVSR